MNAEERRGFTVASPRARIAPRALELASRRLLLAVFPRPRDNPRAGLRKLGEMPARWSAILSKQPLPGAVKTRLIPALGAEAAARLQEAMLEDVVARCSASEDFDTLLAFAPEESAAWFQGRFPTIREQRAQCGAGLAERLAHLFESLLSESSVPRATSLVAIGSDQPLVRTRTIARAHGFLEAGADLVLGPDLGGGYYLVGQREPHPELFTEIEMSTPSMCAETVRLAEERGLDVKLLPEGYDVDVPADLERLRTELVSMDPTDPEFPLRSWETLQSLHPLSS